MSAFSKPKFNQDECNQSTERLRRALGQAFVSHPDLLHPSVLEASRALDREIVRWTKQSQERQKMVNQLPGTQPGSGNCT